MNKFGLIGDPIDTSSSPALFKAGYGGRYSYDLIEGPDFNISYGKFLDEYSGINVTAPFKLEAFSAADRKSDTCSRIGAANLIVKTGDGTMAFNTDFDGIILSVLEAVLHESGNEIYGRYSEGYGLAAKEVPGIYGRRPSALVAGDLLGPARQLLDLPIPPGSGRHRARLTKVLFHSSGSLGPP